jgi:hypothetical protein
MIYKIVNFIVWYKLPDMSFRTFEHETQTLETVQTLDKFEMNQFEMITKTKGDKTDANLIQYSKDLISYRNELLTSKYLIVSFDYFDNDFKMKNGLVFYRNHSNNVKTFIKKFIHASYKSCEPIEAYEESKFLKCNRGGLMFGEVGVYNCYTYDFKFFYPSIMASKDYYIPRTKGKIISFHTIPDIFQFGIYNIQVVSNDKNFNKVFAFSKDNHYTHYSLNFIHYYNKHYKGDIKMNIMNNEALIYDDLISGYTMFNCWYNRLVEIKAEFPKNNLVKKLGSTSWGELQTYKSIIRTEQEVINENLNIGFDMSDDYYIKKIVQKNDTDIYHLVPTKKGLYEYDLRLKAFITDYGRVKIAKQALKNIDDVVRIQTDSITYSTNVNPKVLNFILDDSKTGEFEILNMRIMRPVDI